MAVTAVLQLVGCPARCRRCRAAHGWEVFWLRAPNGINYRGRPRRRRSTSGVAVGVDVEATEAAGRGRGRAATCDLKASDSLEETAILRAITGS